MKEFHEDLSSQVSQSKDNKGGQWAIKCLAVHQRNGLTRYLKGDCAPTQVSITGRKSF